MAISQSVQAKVSSTMIVKSNCKSLSVRVRV